MAKFLRGYSKIMILRLFLLEIICLSAITPILFARNVYWNDSEWRKKSYIQQELGPPHLTEEEKKLYLDLHNKYRRSNLTPSAADMQYMEWDDNLARIIQAWVDGCKWGHGNVNDPSVDGQMGQNLYFGGIRNPKEPMSAWFNEYVDYDFNKHYCQPNKQCGHYTQIVWANSRFVGCAIKLNCPNLNKYYIGCNYYPAGNIIGVRPYKVGMSCSKCSNSDGRLCSDKLCVTKSQCGKYKLKCDCKLHCHNCGILDKEKCTCQCKDGWDGLDCSVPCVDQNAECSEYLCSFYEKNKIINPCRRTCNICRAVDKNNLANTCCDGKICSEGYVLDINSCSCILLCTDCKLSSLNESTSSFIIILIVMITLTLIVAVTIFLLKYYKVEINLGKWFNIRK